MLEAPQGRRTVSSNGCEGLLEALRGLRRVSSCLKAVSERRKTKCRRHCAAGGRFPAPRSRRTVSSSGCEGLLEAARGRRSVSSCQKRLPGRQKMPEALRGLRTVSSVSTAVAAGGIAMPKKHFKLPKGSLLRGRRTVSSNGCEGLLEALRGLRSVSSCQKAVSERHKTKCRRRCEA